jgi:hypothetical protein
MDGGHVMSECNAIAKQMSEKLTAEIRAMVEPQAKKFVAEFGAYDDEFFTRVLTAHIQGAADKRVADGMGVRPIDKEVDRAFAIACWNKRAEILNATAAELSPQ